MLYTGQKPGKAVAIPESLIGADKRLNINAPLRVKYKTVPLTAASESSLQKNTTSVRGLSTPIPLVSFSNKVSVD